MAFDWASYEAQMAPLRELEGRRRFNQILNGILDIMKLPIYPPGYNSDAKEWYVWLLENPVNTPRWKKQ